MENQQHGKDAPKSPAPGGRLADRLRAQQQAPGAPPSSTPLPEVTPILQPPVSVPVDATPHSSQLVNYQEAMLPPQEAGREKAHPARPTYYTDEDIEWVRTGMEIPTAFWRGIVAYVTGQKIKRVPRQQGKVVQKNVFAEALGSWLNDHRNQLPPEIAAEIDEVRAKLNRLP